MKKQNNSIVVKEGCWILWRTQKGGPFLSRSFVKKIRGGCLGLCSDTANEPYMWIELEHVEVIYVSDASVL